MLRTSDSRLPPLPPSSLRIPLPPFHSTYCASGLRYGDFRKFAKLFRERFQGDFPGIRVFLLVCEGLELDHSLTHPWVNWNSQKSWDYMEDPTGVLLKESMSLALGRVLPHNDIQPVEPFISGISAGDLRMKIKELVPGETGENLAMEVRECQLSSCTRYTEEFDGELINPEDLEELRVEYHDGDSVDSDEEEDFEVEEKEEESPGVENCPLPKSAKYVRCNVQTYERGFQLLLALRRVVPFIEFHTIERDDVITRMFLEIQGAKESDLSRDCWSCRCTDIVNEGAWDGKKSHNFTDEFVQCIRKLHCTSLNCEMHKHRIFRSETENNNNTQPSSPSQSTSPWRVQFRAKRKYDAEMLLQQLTLPGSGYAYLSDVVEPELREVGGKGKQQKKEAGKEFEFRGRMKLGVEADHPKESILDLAKDMKTALDEGLFQELVSDVDVSLIPSMKEIVESLES